MTTKSFNVMLAREGNSDPPLPRHSRIMMKSDSKQDIHSQLYRRPPTANLRKSASRTALPKDISSLGVLQNRPLEGINKEEQKSKLEFELSQSKEYLQQLLHLRQNEPDRFSTELHDKTVPWQYQKAEDQLVMVMRHNADPVRRDIKSFISNHSPQSHHEKTSS